MNIRECIGKVASGQHLTRDEAAAAMTALMSGEATHAQMGALLAALRLKGETIDEIAGFAATMRAFAVRVPATRTPLVDTCGTGGDHSGTFNISTTAAFVVAGAGVGVAKHGNRSATSKCGSADVLEALGVNLSAGPGHVARCIDEIGIGFLFARTLHGAMKHVAPVRAELGMPTVFNVLGPLTNPAGAQGQMMGVFRADLAEPLAHVLLALGADRAFVVAGSDGLDELTLTGPSRVAEAAESAVRTYEITPEQFGLAPAPLQTLLGGDAETNAGMLRGVLSGEPGPRRDIVLLNAAPAIVAGGAAATLKEGFERAVEALDSGVALGKLEQLIRMSNDTG